MKATVFLATLPVVFVAFAPAQSETLVLNSGRTMDATVIRTNGNDLMVLTDHGTYNFGRENIKEIQGAKAELGEIRSTRRVPDLKTVVLTLARQKWGGDLTQIPATVIDKGMFRNVPYVSFRCSDDYEVNIYGDLKDPAAVEAGVYRKLLGDEAAKSNCIAFIGSILGEAEDKDILPKLSLQKDLKVRNKLSFEITPPTDDDAYQGWWISVFSEQKLNGSRASEKEMETISLSKTDAANGAKSGDNAPEWSAQELKLARPSTPETISFTSPSGEVVANAEVVRVVDNAYLIWRRGVSGGMVRLADLPEDLRSRFGYDAHKAAVFYAAEERRHAQSAQERSEAAQAAASDFGSYSDGGSSASGGGSVYVHGYYRSNGTYVHSYTRSK